METESSERRYNTRFRGVPRSIFTYSRSKKSSKSSENNNRKTQIKDDFVYTKLGKKSSSYAKEAENPLKIKSETAKIKEEISKIRGETVEPVPKLEKKVPPPPEVIPNGTHKSPPVEVTIEKTNSKNDSHESSPEVDKMEGIFFEPKESEDANSTPGSGAKSHWIESKEKLSWNSSTVASYNPKTKMFRCVVCQAVGFMSRIGEHYLGTHCNAKVFHCPQCSYCSAWWRCVRNHMSKNHGVSNAPASMWKNQPLLDEIMQILQNLKYSVDCEDRVERVAENYGKRYICPKCPYATDRRDLYNRHENIHREEKPFQCYICYKLFNRADHVKKHFCRIHKEFNYDINLIRRLPSKRSRIPVSASLNGSSSSNRPPLDLNASFQDMISRPPSVPIPVTQSHLLNCLTGSPTMVRMNREYDHHLPPNKITPLEKEIKPETAEKNDNTFNKSHSNLLTFLTQNAFSTKSSTKPAVAPRNTDTPIKDILQEALLKPPGCYSSSFMNAQPKKFNCPYCPWTGPNSWALRLHTSMHYKTFCVLCNFKSTEASDLENHMWECHRKRSCSKCNFLADSLLALDAHMLEVHGQKPQFACRHCSQTFEVRSDMEAHCIFIHNQVLQECKEKGCDFCTTDPSVLETHRKDNHNSSTSQDPSASRTLCLYCGCDFADPQSLSLHEELFHENPLQKAARRPLNPYCCSVCGYSTPKQPMMMEHMRIHTGQTLKCQAGEGCHFDTPYDTVLREHVLQSHSDDDDCIVRCPHCGFRCSTRYSFVTHYKELHHPFCCQLCEELEHKYFVRPFNTSSYLDSSIKAMFPFAKKLDSDRALSSSSANNDSPEKSNNDDAGRRSRKQMQPRKVVVQDTDNEDSSSKKDGNIKSTDSTTKTKIKHSNHNNRNRAKEKFLSLYSEKVKKLAQASLYKCRICVKSPIFFRHKRNYLLHRQWHYLKKHQCNKCIQTFCHRYQVLLHQREHVLNKNNNETNVSSS